MIQFELHVQRQMFTLSDSFLASNPSSRSLAHALQQQTKPSLHSHSHFLLKSETPNATHPHHPVFQYFFISLSLIIYLLFAVIHIPPRLSYVLFPPSCFCTYPFPSLTSHYILPISFVSSSLIISGFVLHSLINIEI